MRFDQILPVRVRIAVGLLAAATLLSATGCASLSGHWVGEDLTPAMARDQFKFLRPAEEPGNFIRTELRLQQDGTFTAETDYDGKMQHSMGTWKYDDKGFLNFTDKQGNAYGYGLRKVNDQTIEIVRGIKGTDVTLTLKKQP